jgi:methionine sulfoxide reductase heme-binding subunit
MPRGWPIVGWAAAGIGAMTAAILAIVGTGPDGIRVLIRATARTSVVLFTAAFVASSLARTAPGPASRWLLANRRYVGVSFAVSHLAHFLAILALAGWSFSRMARDAAPLVAVLGGVGYLFVIAMTATSFDRTAAWLGARRWRRLHTTGLYYLWVVFFASFAPRAFHSALYWPFALGLLAALALRLRHGASRRALAGLPAAR